MALHLQFKTLNIRKYGVEACILGIFGGVEFFYSVRNFFAVLPEGSAIVRDKIFSFSGFKSLNDKFSQWGLVLNI